MATRRNCRRTAPVGARMRAPPGLATGEQDRGTAGGAGDAAGQAEMLAAGDPGNVGGVERSGVVAVLDGIAVDHDDGDGGVATPVERELDAFVDDEVLHEVGAQLVAEMIHARRVSPRAPSTSTSRIPTRSAKGSRTICSRARAGRIRSLGTRPRRAVAFGR